MAREEGDALTGLGARWDVGDGRGGGVVVARSG